MRSVVAVSRVARARGDPLVPGAAPIWIAPTVAKVAGPSMAAATTTLRAAGRGRQGREIEGDALFGGTAGEEPHGAGGALRGAVEDEVLVEGDLFVLVEDEGDDVDLAVGPRSPAGGDVPLGGGCAGRHGQVDDTAPRQHVRLRRPDGTCRGRSDDGREASQSASRTGSPRAVIRLMRRSSSPPARRSSRAASRSEARRIRAPPPVPGDIPGRAAWRTPLVQPVCRFAVLGAGVLPCRRQPGRTKTSGSLREEHPSKLMRNRSRQDCRPLRRGVASALRQRDAMPAKVPLASKNALPEGGRRRCMGGAPPAGAAVKGWSCRARFEARRFAHRHHGGASTEDAGRLTWYSRFSELLALRRFEPSACSTWW